MLKLEIGQKSVGVLQNKYTDHDSQIASMMLEMNRLNNLVQSKEVEIDDLRAKLRQADIRIEA